MVILLNETDDSVPTKRVTSCSAGISREKIATGLLVRLAALYAKLRAKAVLPTEGRAATIIMSPAWKPWVILLMLSKPVVKPLTPSVLISFGVSIFNLTASATCSAFLNSETLLFSVASLSTFSLSAIKPLTSSISSFKNL